MTTLELAVKDPKPEDAVPGDTWLSDRSWSRLTWTVAELEAAKAGGDKKKIAQAQEALEARKAWLGALKN